MVFVRDHGGNSDIYVMDLGSTLHLLVDSSQYDFDPVFSPDGRQVLFDTSPDGYAQLHLVSSDGGAITPISQVSDGWATFPAWSPDGRKIVYSCGLPTYDSSDLCVLSPQDKFLGTLGGQTKSQELEPSWSPDGRTVAFASNRSGDADVYLIDVKTGSVTRLTSGTSHDGDPAWSPDGSTIAFTSDRNGKNQVCVMRRNGSHVRCVTDGIEPSWSPDGKSLTFYKSTLDGTRIFLVHLDGTGLTQITS